MHSVSQMKRHLFLKDMSKRLFRHDSFLKRRRQSLQHIWGK